MQHQISYYQVLQQTTITKGSLETFYCFPNIYYAEKVCIYTMK